MDDAVEVREVVDVIDRGKRLRHRMPEVLHVNLRAELLNEPALHNIEALLGLALARLVDLLDRLPGLLAELADEGVREWYMLRLQGIGELG